MENGLGFAHFLSETDMLGRIVLILLLGLSVASWYLIVIKAWADYQARRRADAFLRQFWAAESLQALTLVLQQQPRDNAFSELAHQALEAARDNRQHGLQKLAAAGGLSEFLTRVLRNGIDQEAARVEQGLTVMASAGSAAPYIGLFGTVWGIMNSFRGLAQVQQATLATVAPGIAEALIATAIGLFAAIPAVIAYNRFSARGEQLIARYYTFADEFQAILHRKVHTSEE